MVCINPLQYKKIYACLDKSRKKCIPFFLIPLKMTKPTPFPTNCHRGECFIFIDFIL